MHTYEVFVDIREYLAANTSHNETERYEIHANTKRHADDLARAQARADHPLGAEYDIRMIRVLR